MFSEIAHFKGKTVRAYMYHKLYGDQILTIYNFQPLYLEDKVGFIVGNHKIFMHCDEIEDFKFEKNMLEINGTLYKIAIKEI